MASFPPNFNLPGAPCSGRVCAGRCTGPCPAGYVCQKNNFGVNHCVQNKSIWEQWWFWVILVLGVIILILILYMIYRAIDARRSKSVTPISAPAIPARPAPMGLPGAGPPAYNPLLAPARPQGNLGLPAYGRAGGF